MAISARLNVYRMYWHKRHTTANIPVALSDIVKNLIFQNWAREELIIFMFVIRVYQHEQGANHGKSHRQSFNCTIDTYPARPMLAPHTRVTSLHWLEIPLPMICPFSQEMKLDQMNKRILETEKVILGTDCPIFRYH